MRRKQFSEDQIVRILDEFEQGKSVECGCGWHFGRIYRATGSKKIK